MDNRDGTYDVKFDDGDRDREVPNSSIKKLGGDKVEARCKGSKKHYPGKIFMDNRDGTYDVKFDDGDRDREVPKSSIKKLGGDNVRDAGSEAKLSEGDKVEARCKGSKKHYP